MQHWDSTRTLAPDRGLCRDGWQEDSESRERGRELQHRNNLCKTG